jgi:hypothetical protein
LTADRRQLAAWAGLITWSGLLVVVVYGSALDLPYLADDYLHIPYVDTHSLTQMWQTSEGLYYFRPLSFVLWKLMYLILGRHDLVAQHTLNLSLHWINGLTVAWLAGHLWVLSPRDSGRADWIRRYLSATLFLLYPFSYEAVPWIGSLVHPLVTTLILLALVCYLRMRATNSRAWGAMSLGLTFLSPFAHESGVLIAPLIAAIELTDPSPSTPLWRRLRRAAWWLIPTVLWAIVWWAVPSQRGAGHVALNTGTNLIRDGLYFAQGTAYPLTWLGGRLRDDLGINEFVAAGGLSVLALTAAALLQWRSGADRRSGLPWLWIGIAALPVILFLDFWYVSAAPRMLMLASVGIAWLWSDVFLCLAHWGQATLTRRRLSIALAAGLCCAVLIQNYGFIVAQMQVYELGGSALRQAIAATEKANQEERAAIFINLPVWIALPRVTYALGQEGVAFLFPPPPDEMGNIVSIHTGMPANMYAAKVDAIRQETPYYAGVLGAAPNWSSLADSGGHVFVAQYAPDQVSLQLVGTLAVPSPTSEPIAHFENSIALLAAGAALDGSQLQVDLTWQAQEPPPSDVTVFVHVLDANGQLIAQADGDPLGGAYPFTQWTPGLIALDRRTAEVDSPGLSLRVGLYDRASGVRLPARMADGAAWPDDAVSIPIQD